MIFFPEMMGAAHPLEMKTLSNRKHIEFELKCKRFGTEVGAVHVTNVQRILQEHQTNCNHVLKTGALSN